MSAYVKIIDSTLSRDIRSRGLVETDRAKADEYLMKSKMIKGNLAAQDEINTIKAKLAEIDSVKSDLAEIKNLLNCLINKE